MFFGILQKIHLLIIFRTKEKLGIWMFQYISQYFVLVISVNFNKNPPFLFRKKKLIDFKLN
jgi:hypothetical protein